MSPYEALKAHLDAYPELPVPVPQVGTKEWNDWRTALLAWSAEKTILEMERDGIPRMEFTRQQPIVTPRADYDWRDMGAKVERQRAKWRAKKARQTPEQKERQKELRRLRQDNLRKQREQERKDRAILIREGLNERKAS